VIAQALAGCDSRSTPLAPSPAQQETGIQLKGTVRDAAWRPLAGARVEAVEGAGAGVSANAGPNGEFSLNGAFDETTRFRASKDGHAPTTSPFPPSCERCNPHWWIHFTLEALAPHPDLAGSYVVAFAADTACADLPDGARARSYGVTVALDSSPDAPANSRFLVAFSRPPFLDDYSSFQIGIAGDYVAGGFGDGHGTPGLVEQIATNTYLALDGWFESRVTDGSTIEATFTGLVEYCQSKGPMGANYSCSAADAAASARCESRNHRLTLTRR
jgi:hypothetical protein